MHQETTEVLSDESKNKLPLFSHLSPGTQKDNKKKKETTYTTHTDSHTQYAALAEVGSVSARFWLRCDGADWESEKSAWIKIYISDHCKTSERGRRRQEALSLFNFHSETKQECKSNYHGRERATSGATRTRERDKSEAGAMSQLVSLTSEHLITSILLQRVQMESLDGTGTDRRKALIGCLWLSGRRSRAIILSLGGDTLTSYLVGSSLPPSAFQFFHLFIAPHFHIQSPIKPDAAALCLLLPHHLPLAWVQISGLMNTLSCCFAGDWCASSRGCDSYVCVSFDAEY